MRFKKYILIESTLPLKCQVKMNLVHTASYKMDYFKIKELHFRKMGKKNSYKIKIDELRRREQMSNSLFMVC